MRGFQMSESELVAADVADLAAWLSDATARDQAWLTLVAQLSARERRELVKWALSHPRHHWAARYLLDDMGTDDIIELLPSLYGWLVRSSVPGVSVARAVRRIPSERVSPYLVALVDHVIADPGSGYEAYFELSRLLLSVGDVASAARLVRNARLSTDARIREFSASFRDRVEINDLIGADSPDPAVGDATRILDLFPSVEEPTDEMLQKWSGLLNFRWHGVSTGVGISVADEIAMLGKALNDVESRTIALRRLEGGYWRMRGVIINAVMPQLYPLLLTPGQLGDVARGLALLLDADQLRPHLERLVGVVTSDLLTTTDAFECLRTLLERAKSTDLVASVDAAMADPLRHALSTYGAFRRFC